MKVRQATETDLPTISKYGKEFYDQTRHSAHSPYNAEMAEALVLQMIRDTGGVFVATTDDGAIVGICGGIVYPLWLTDQMSGQELFWYVDPDHRKSRAGKLLFEALEGWAKEAGAQSFCMVALSHMHENRVGQMYEAKGYVPLEKSYIKVF